MGTALHISLSPILTEKNIHMLFQNPQSHIRYWIPVILYCTMIFYISSQSYPSRHLPSIFMSLSDKLVHAVEYGILGILLYRAFHQTTPTNKSISLAVIGALAFGISDEFHQWFVPHRQADTWDVVADTLGASCFIFLWVFLTKRF